MTTPPSSVVLQRFGALRRAPVSAKIFQLLARPDHSLSVRIKIPKRGYASQQSELITRNHHTPYSNGSANHSNLADAVKLNMRSVKTSVSIITSSNPGLDPSGDESTWRGATVASFTTVCMNPYPLVSFNIHQNSSTLDAIKSSGYFAVNVLSSTPNAAYLADLFAKPNEESPFTIAQESLGRPTKFYAGRDWFMNELKIRMAKNPLNLPPRIQITQRKTQFQGILFSLLCNTGNGLRMIAAGDHVIVLGRVVHILSARGTRTFLHADSPSREAEMVHKSESLTYQHGRYSAGPDDIKPRRVSSAPWDSRKTRWQPDFVDPDVDSDSSSMAEAVNEGVKAGEDTAKEQSDRKTAQTDY